MEQLFQKTTPRLEIGAVAPNFTLEALHGNSVSRSSYRSRRHLAIVFAPVVDLPLREYLEELSRAYPQVRAADGELLAIITDTAAHADGLRAALELPFPLLLDPDGTTSRHYLPDGAPYGVFVLDRYAALHAQWTLTAPPLPAVEELVEWLGVLNNQCTL